MSYRNFVYTVGPRAASLVVAILLATPLVAVAESGEFEEVFVNGQAVQADSFIVEITKQDIVDTSQYLKMMPGANSNSNGVLSGIAQYRGLFGERVAVSIDDVEPVSGGPNAMDAPLSYSSPMITEALTLHRGISSIRLAPETIGGHVNAELARGKFGLSDTFLSSGFLGSNYRTNGSQSTNALRLTGANSSHRLSVLAEIDRGEDIETPRGDIFPSDMHRNRFDLSYAYQSDTSHMMAYVGKLDTKDTGSPALVMDIRTIETDLAGFEYDRTINEALSYGLKFSYNDVHHTMDNFSLRTPPGDPMMYRLNNASGEASGLQAYGKYSLEFVAINLGINVKQAAHNSTITNPNMAMFQVANFNDVEKDLQSIYAEFAGDNNEGMQWEFGVRHNRHSTNAGEVSSAGMMAMMVENTDSLATAFNNANRDLSFSNTDAVAKYTRSLTANSKFLLEIGSKSRAPSYQELYLWLPLETTGGLADGRTYIGNLELNSERSNEVNLGYEFTGARSQFSPQIFYRKIDDYIQGTASANMMANMLSTMMTGEAPLQYTNVDARIWGLDMAWNYHLHPALFIEGVVSLVKGERSDEKDNLYRQSPNNTRLALHYYAADWHFIVENHLYAGQDKVSAFNDEQASAGYGVVNFRAAWEPRKGLNVEARLDNVGDQTYQDHLSGVNRVMGSDMTVGERIYGSKRSISLGLMYSF